MILALPDGLKMLKTLLTIRSVTLLACRLNLDACCEQTIVGTISVHDLPSVSDRSVVQVQVSGSKPDNLQYLDDEDFPCSSG